MYRRSMYRAFLLNEKKMILMIAFIQLQSEFEIDTSPKKTV